MFMAEPTLQCSLKKSTNVLVFQFGAAQLLGLNSLLLGETERHLTYTQLILENVA